MKSLPIPGFLTKTIPIRRQKVNGKADFVMCWQCVKKGMSTGVSDVSDLSDGSDGFFSIFFHFLNPNMMVRHAPNQIGSGQALNRAGSRQVRYT
jgi:hypothetical protein